MTSVQTEIAEIESYLQKQMDADASLDSRKLKRLCDLKVERMKELVVQHKTLITDRENRFREMRQHTDRYVSMTKNLTAEQLKLNAPAIEAIFLEADNYDLAATRWAEQESCPWSESNACSIMAAIMVMINEIC